MLQRKRKNVYKLKNKSLKVLFIVYGVDAVMSWLDKHFRKEKRKKINLCTLSSRIH